MEDFKLLKNQDINIVMDYLEKNHIESTFIIGNIEKYGLENNKLQKRNGDYYGYFNDGGLRGVFSFTNMGSFICHYEDDRILNKIVLLKAVKKYKPKHIFGVKKMIEPLWKKLERTFEWYSYDDCNYMILSGENFQDFPVDNEIVKAKDFDFFKTVDFLIEVEKAFDRKPKTVNELKNSVYERIGEEEYLYLLDKDKVVAQAVIKTTTSKINQIEGVYTLPAYRGNGYAKAIVSKLCKNIIEKGKTPALIVSKTNEPAKNAYEKIGFEYYDDYIMAEIKVT
ncbi:GNAT family N-acetyltransferase [Wukongibacter baidiensis]|uniref:GNAT family N-acetyltransferase n=1 Tax=Wukongibacter baidiensis TaxID=1723361 RepID=UPI003D7F1D9B